MAKTINRRCEGCPTGLSCPMERVANVFLAGKEISNLPEIKTSVVSPVRDLSRPNEIALYCYQGQSSIPRKDRNTSLAGNAIVSK